MTSELSKEAGDFFALLGEARRYVSYGSLLRLRKARGTLLLVTLVVILSWLVTTNHCAIAQAVGAVVSNCHAPAAREHCPSHKPTSDTSENGQGQMECCWALKAWLNPAKSLAPHDTSLASLFVDKWFHPEFLWLDFGSEASLAWHWDHGPPKVRSFAEQVLQRCILGNAPPV